MTPDSRNASSPSRHAPRTRMNDDHSMHIPGISSHRNVNNSKKNVPEVLAHGTFRGTLTPESRGLQSPR